MKLESISYVAEMMESFNNLEYWVEQAHYDRIDEDEIIECEIYCAVMDYYLNYRLDLVEPIADMDDNEKVWTKKYYDPNFIKTLELYHHLNRIMGSTKYPVDQFVSCIYQRYMEKVTEEG